MLHIIKLVVGLDSLEAFAEWQAQERVLFDGQEANIVRTRHTPAQADEILKTEGSIYRVINSKIVCRQKIIGFDTDVNQKRGSHCIILLDTEIIRTVPTFKRPFQGWRYLKPDGAPKDLGTYMPGKTDKLSPTERELLEAGLI